MIEGEEEKRKTKLKGSLRTEDPKQWIKTVLKLMDVSKGKYGTISLSNPT